MRHSCFDLTDSALVLLSLWLSHGVFATEVPEEAELESMSLSPLLAFNDDVQEKGFSDFYKELVPLWQGQTRPAIRVSEGRRPEQHRNYCLKVMFRIW